MKPMKKGARPIDLGETYGEHLALLHFLLRDVPASVDIDELHLPLAAFASEFGEDLTYQQAPLLRKIAEGRAEENTDGS
jgi:hypothetical protein